MKTFDDVCFDALWQVRVPRWCANRVALGGEAAWCPTPLTGIGTSPVMPSISTPSLRAIRALVTTLLRPGYGEPV